MRSTEDQLIMKSLRLQTQIGDVVLEWQEEQEQKQEQEGGGG